MPLTKVNGQMLDGAINVDSSGNVSVGTTTALATAAGRGNITINGSSGSILSFGTGGSLRSYIFQDPTTMYVTNSSTGPINFEANGVQGMSISAAGRVTMPVQPAFLASNTTLAYTGTTNSSPFAFNNTTLNVGSVFNTSTYRFTAPIAGRYLLYFSFFFDVNVGTSNCDTLFYVNGSQLSGGTAATLASRPNQDRITVGNTLVLNLNANDYVDVRGRDSTGTGNGIYGPHSYFGGYLVG